MPTTTYSSSLRFPQYTDPQRWVVLSVFCVVYFFVYFHRVSPSVIVPDLLAAFKTQAAALGFMSSMYFYLYALEQPLVGYLSDRLGPQRIVGLWSLAAASGCFLFGLAPTIGWAAVGRGLIGLGVGGVYIPALKAFSQWFQKREFATMTGLLLASGNLGAIVATTPLAWMAHTWGWRSTFFIIGVITVGFAIAILTLIRDPKSSFEEIPHTESLPEAEKKLQNRQSVFYVFGSLRFWVLAAIFFGSFGPYLTFQGLWATPFLMSILSLDRLHASGLNMLIPVGFVVGAPICGYIADRVSSKINFLTFLLAVQTGIWVCLTFGISVLETGSMIPILVFLGSMTGGLATVLWALVRETTPEMILGTTTGLINPFGLIGAASLQMLTGALVGRVGMVNGIYPPSAYSDAFIICLSITAICLILSAVFRRYLSGKG